MHFARLILLIVPLVLAQPVASESGGYGKPDVAASPIMTRVAKAYPAVDLPPRANRPAASPKERSSINAPAKGVFLVASDSLSDPNFSQTVVLLLEYDKSGAIGLVINRPTEVSLASLLPEVEGLKDRKELVFLGGPVGGGQLFLLVRSTNRPHQSEEIVDGVYASASLQTLREIIAEESAVSVFQAYAGYAGWGPGQLDAELLRGDWLVTPADSETLFDKAPDVIWPELIRQNKGLWVYRQADVSFPFRLVSKGQSTGENPTYDALAR